MQKEKSKVKLWTQVHAQSSETNERKIQPDIFKNVYKSCCVFSAKTPPSYPTIVWLNFSQEHIRLPLICKQTSSLLPIGWQDMSPLPLKQSVSHNSALQRGQREGKMRVRAGMWRRKVMTEAGGEEE